MSGKAVASAVSGYVPTSRTVNGKALSSNISLSASDVGALPDSTVIPTVNNATLTIQKNGTTVKTFTANASTDVTANITVPTKVSDLTNDSGFISGITSSDVTTALGYTPYNSSNPSGYQANVIETVKVNGTALTPSSKAVDITVPTVNNATLTITQGGTTKGTFTANASSNVTIDLDSGGSVDVDNKSITTNASDQIQAIGVINSRDSSTAIKTWTGTKAQYDAITTKDSATLYNITDDTDVNLTILEALYPVGSVYITTAGSCPLSTLISGSTWTQEICRQLVEKKEPTSNDPTWYNLYSDGWCEQGGIVKYTSDSLTTVNLSKAYTNTDYCVQITVAIVGSAAINDSMNAQRFSASNVTVSSFQVRGNGTNTYNRQSWFACGYTSTTTTHKRFRRTA
jgi:hypothetical protein